MGTASTLACMVEALGVGLLSNEVDSWMTGVNRNVEGKSERVVNRYSGSAPAYRAKCDEVAGKGYQDLALADVRRAKAMDNLPKAGK